MLVLWDCNVCGLRFETAAGGLCSKCRMPVCKGHLHEQKNSGLTTYLCTPCFPNQDREEQVMTLSAAVIQEDPSCTLATPLDSSDTKPPRAQFPLV